jgi:isoleucyl-tRNA synthetase
MHKSWGNAIEFNEAAERMGVDVMRWMYARQRPEDNILFGYRTADEARRELLVLWNVFAFFVTYARLAGWRATSTGGGQATNSVLDRWILSRTAAAAREVGADLADFDARGAALRLGSHIDELSTWYLRRTRRRISRNADEVDRDAAFATLHAALIGTARMLAPILPFLSEDFYQQLVVALDNAAPESVHLTRWPEEDFAAHRDEALEEQMSVVLRAVDLARTLRSQAGLRTRQPIGHVWITLPGGGELPQEMIEILADELNAKVIEYIPDDSALIERRVKPLLAKIGKRLGGQTQEVLAAARANDVEYLSGGGVRLAGVELAADEVEILATPRSGTAIAHDEGLVVVIDTEIDDALRAEGDARELQRAVQDLRKQVGLELDETVSLWVEAPDAVLAPLRPHLARLAEDTLAELANGQSAPSDASTATQEVTGGSVTIRLRRTGGR